MELTIVLLSGIQANGKMELNKEKPLILLLVVTFLKAIMSTIKDTVQAN